MRILVVALMLVSGLSTMNGFANNSDSIAIGRFSFIDVNQPADALSEFNENEFRFLLNETLAMKTSLRMVEESQADRIVIGRVTRLNEAGDARVEIAFVTGDVSLDNASDMVAIEVSLDDSDDAIMALVDDVYHMVYLSLDTNSGFNRAISAAGR